jgi:hypothetical protein
LQRLIGWEEGGKLLVVGLKVAVTNASASDNFFGVSSDKLYQGRYAQKNFLKIKKMVKFEL